MNKTLVISESLISEWAKKFFSHLTPECAKACILAVLKSKMAKPLVAAALLAMTFTSSSQTIDPNHPPQPGDVTTNIPRGISAVVDFGLGLLPYWDKNASNAFGSELLLLTGPAWKSSIISGSTPYVDLGAEWYFVPNFGIGADAVTFGNGSGSSVLDSAHGDLLARAISGNVAGFVILGGGRDLTLNRYDVEFGGGFEFRYSNGIGLRLDTRYCKLFEKFSLFNKSTDHEFLTRLVLDLPLPFLKH